MRQPANPEKTPPSGRKYRVLYRDADGTGHFTDVSAKSLAAAAWQVAISLDENSRPEFIDVSLLPKTGGAS